MLRSKLPDIKTSIFAVMTQMANENNAINLSQGFPDFQVSKKLIDLVEKYMKKGFNQYAPMQGVFELREQISKKTFELYNHKYNPDTEITITAGATQAIYTTINAFINEGDEVILFEPAYDSYLPAIRINGGQPVYVQLKAPEYKIDWNEIKRVISIRTKMIIINTPHNPSGAIFTEEDIMMLRKIVSGSKILILSDEVYEHIIFDGNKHQSLAKYPDLIKRSIIISSFGKTLHTTGWKIGYCMAPEKIMNEFRKVHQFTVFSVNTPIQYAISEYIEKEDEYMNLSSFYQEKRDYFISLVSNSKFKLIPSKGTYFQILDYSEISDEKDVEFAKRLVLEFGIASVPVSAFYHNHQDNKALRFCFAKSNKTLDKAAEKLLKIS